ncbi:GNAT family N-acetyltransferase [Vannielia litorea]|uniref:GNAT family N-acetyltransferase n=1 Tax=Vannielia litorea TaxID=1217970 RepID=UPI001BD0DDD4|nr:GNAT family N-acetyltransferase [Vannielia litorea]MBS8225215.1 N-acetyltransferase [Vannielia litorea]
MQAEQLDILTERLRIRPLEAGDAPRLAALGGRPEVARMMLTFKAPWPESDVLAWIEASRYRGAPGFRLAIEARETPGLIGIIGLGANPATLMYFIAAAQGGRGYATEAGRAFLAWAFATFGLEAVEADHFHDNPSSGRVLRKLGFEIIGQGSATNPLRLEPEPITLYRLTRNAFEATQCNS